MINLRKVYIYTFARNRNRREIQFQPKLKDFTSQEAVRLQTQQFRKQFEKVPTQTFSDVLKTVNPKMGDRFFIKKQKLNKQIRNVYKKGIDLKNLQPSDEKDFQFLAASQSHLLDQKQQIEFEQKFKQQLFRTKQTKRLVEKKQKYIGNYVEGGQKDEEFLRYENAKRLLKNKKINNMMDMNRNNEQLQLLIQSGLFKNPDNIQTIIDELNNKSNRMLQHHQTGEAVQIQQAKSAEIVLDDSAKQQKVLANQIDDIGPQKLKQRHKITEFIEKYEQQSEKDKESSLEDIKILKQIRDYEQKLFVSRYDAINFRFKGRVSFKFFHQNQLVSYIKNENIEPVDLLTIFEQNRNQISKLNVPIITPHVASALYSKTSLYKFPETKTNNRINMLNDPKFQALEKHTFRNISKVNDTDFCSAVWAYAQNHRDEHGMLKVNLSNKINEVIAQQLCDRISNLNDKDLGLVLRAACFLNLNQHGQKWNEVVSYLSTRLQHIKQSYAIQSAFQFLMCLPVSPEITQIVLKNIKLYNQYEWEQVNTVLSFTHSAGLILKQKQNLGKQTKINQMIKKIIAKQYQNLFKILPSLSINNMGQFLTVLRESVASLAQPKLVNLCKKLVVQNIKSQKQLAKDHSFTNLIGNFALIDIQKYLSKKYSKFKNLGQSNKPIQILRKVCLKQILPFQPIAYNSSEYFIYHQLATISYKQMYNIPNILLSKLLENLSLVRYKNQTLMDEIANKIMEGLQQPSASQQFVPNKSHKTRVKQLIGVINSYALHRRNCQILNRAIQLIFSDQYYSILGQESPNSIIRLFTGILAIQSRQQIQSYQQRLTKILEHVILAQQQMPKIFIEEELTATAFCTIILNEYSLFQMLSFVNIEQLNSAAARFVFIFGQFLLKLTRRGQTQIGQSEKEKLEKVEKQFFNEVNDQILYNQLCIGSPQPQSIIYQRMVQKLKDTHQGKQISEKKWFIEVQQQKTAYFVATYDQLATHNNAQNQEKVVRLATFGVWKLYLKYYELRGWSVKTIVSFLQAK